GVASGAQHFENVLRDFVGVFDLTQNPDLHVVHQQSNPLWIANFLERLREVDSECAFHVRVISPLSNLRQSNTGLQHHWPRTICQLKCGWPITPWNSRIQSGIIISVPRAAVMSPRSMMLSIFQPNQSLRHSVTCFFAAGSLPQMNRL